MCQTEEEFNLWYNALKYVWDQVRQRQTRPRDRILGLPQHHSASPGARGIVGPSTPSARCSSMTGTPLGGGQSHGFAIQNLGIPASRNIPGDCYIWGAAPEDTQYNDLVKVTSPQLVPSSQKLDIIQVSCGSTHFAAVTRSGHLYSWGAGPSGALGLGSTQFLSIPTTIPELCCVRSVSCGESSSSALTEDGGLYTWGSGLTGQLGHGQHTTQYYPKRLPFALGVRIRQVSCGPYHSSAVCESGGVYTWGDGFGGKLGHGTSASEFRPKRLSSVDHVLGVSCGYWHTAIWARYPNNDPSSDVLTMYTWGGHCSWGGDNNKGCLGNGKKTGEWHPYRVEGLLESKSIKQVACGLNLTVALTQDGEVYQMGSTGAEAAQVPWDRTSVPIRVEGALKKLKIEQIACGRQHGIAVGASQPDRRTHLFSWGVGKRGQLGLGSYQDHSTPQLVEDLTSRRILNVCCGGDYTLAVCSHDHKVAAANISPSVEFLPSPSAPDLSPASTQNARRNKRNHGTIINANQLRMPLKKTVLAHRENPILGHGSMEQISISTGSSTRKMKSELLTGGGGVGGTRLDRSRTGSTPLSDAPSSSHDLKGTPRVRQDLEHARQLIERARSQTPDNTKASELLPPSLSHQYSSQGSARNLVDGLEAFASDPGDSSSDDGVSLANTDGQLTHDAYSDDDEVSSQGPRSEKSLGSIDHGLTKSISETFRTPICTFPPTSTDDGVPQGGQLQVSASTARLRSRQRGLERRLGIMDTWTSEQVISKHISAPISDLMDGVSHHRQIQTARTQGQLDETSVASSSRRAGSGYEHRRSASAQNLMLSTLEEDVVDPVRSQKKVRNFGRFLESVERKLMVLAAQQNRELSQTLMNEFSFLSKFLGQDRGNSLDKIDSFFEMETVEKNREIISKISELLTSLPLFPQHDEEEENEVSNRKLKTMLSLYDQTISGLRDLVAELQSLHQMDPVHRQDPVRDQGLLRQEGSGLIGSFVSQEIDNENQNTLMTTADGQLVHAWRERVDPGVSIVFQSTPNGLTKIKKIRFAKRMFAWDEAQRWWENNQDRLIKQYGLEPGYDPLQDTHGGGGGDP
eukprot:g990.t1